MFEASIILAGLLVVMIPWLLMKRHARRQIGRRIETDDPTGVRELVYFWGPSCVHCKTMTPLVDSLIEEGRVVRKVNVAEAPQLARTYGVMGLPTCAVVEGGVITAYHTGALGRQGLLDLLVQ